MKEDIKAARNILETCLNACDESPQDYSFFELKALIDTIKDNLGYDDWSLDLDSAECRLIEEDSINEIWTESLIEQVKECYDLSEVPSFVAIDWEQTAENCKVDGLGHHFSGYDGQEHNSGNYYIFRTN